MAWSAKARAAALEARRRKAKTLRATGQKSWPAAVSAANKRRKLGDIGQLARKLDRETKAGNKKGAAQTRAQLKKIGPVSVRRVRSLNEQVSDIASRVNSDRYAKGLAASKKRSPWLQPGENSINRRNRLRAAGITDVNAYLDRAIKRRKKKRGK